MVIRKYLATFSNVSCQTKQLLIVIQNTIQNSFDNEAHSAAEVMSDLDFTFLCDVHQLCCPHSST